MNLTWRLVVSRFVLLIFRVLYRTVKYIVNASTLFISHLTSYIAHAFLNSTNNNNNNKNNNNSNIVHHQYICINLNAKWGKNKKENEKHQIISEEHCKFTVVVIFISRWFYKYISWTSWITLTIIILIIIIVVHS